MGDRSPKEKMKKQKQHDKDHEKVVHKKEENMIKNRREQPVAVDRDDNLKKAG
jgi:hypothetical protein